MSLHRLVTALEAAGVWHQARGDRIYFRCPLPDHEDRDASASADWHAPSGDRPGQVRFQCHRCGRDRNGDVVAALGLAWTDLYDDAPARPLPSSPRAGHPRPAPVAPSAPADAARMDKSAAPRRVPTRRTTRVFTDADGTERFRLHRYDPIPDAPGAAEADKGFSWQHRGGPRGGWRKGKRCQPSEECPACADGRTPALVPLYRLPDVLAAAEAGRRVWITEGGKNADQLQTMLPTGEVATTAPDGARAPWAAEYTAAITSGAAPVTVVADRDRPGYEHAAAVAAELDTAGATVQVVRTPLEQDGADASNHLDAGFGPADFEPIDPATAAAGEAHASVAPTVAAAPAEAVDLDEERAARRGQQHHASGKGKGKGGDNGGGGGAARQLLQLARELWEPLWTTTDECYVIPQPGKGPKVARPLRGGARSLSAELVAELYDRTEMVAPGYAVTDSLKVLQGMAQRTEPVELANRVARHGDALVLDLGDDTGRAVVITADGWQVADESPVLFKRTARTGALPVPERGGDLEELWNLVHVRPRDRALAEADLVHRYFAGVSHPLLYLRGEAGTGKTTAAETLTSLIDPAPAVKVSLPNDPKDWAVQIGQAYSLVLDNVTNLAQWQSDALCMAVTGGHTVYRALYTDGGLAQFGGQQCLTLTSVDLGSQRSDLTTRMLPIELERFDDRERLSEEQLRQAQEDSRGRLLGALLDRAAAVLATLPRVDELDLNLPRLSDFARTCKALDLLDADRGVSADRHGDYLRLVAEQAGDIADEDEVAIAVIELMNRREAAGHGPWQGNAKELHVALGQQALSRSRFWPETAVALGKRLSAVAGPLREAGVIVERERSAAGRTITLRRASSSAGETQQPPLQPQAVERAEPATTTSGTAQTSMLAGSVPCEACRVPGDSCGFGGAADEPAPCVLCDQPTRVQSRCGAHRHGRCQRGGSTPPPQPNTPSTGAEKATEAHDRAGQDQSTNAATRDGHQPPQRTARARTEPRRGLHLYGVLDEQALTVVTDRHPGPSEPLEERYPRTLERGCIELARRYNLEALWVHDSALPRFGLDAESEEPPKGSKIGGWQVADQGEPEAVELGIPAWLTGTGTWTEARTGRELAAALANYEDALGMRFRAAPAATALALLGMLHKRHGARRLITPTALPPREVCASERDLSWCRPLTNTEAGAGYVVGLDKHGAYPGVMKSLSLGMGDPTHYPEGNWDAKLPGRHRVVNVTPAADRDPLLPDPLTGVARDGEWRCTETLRYAAEQGVQFEIAESYIWPDQSQPLATFAERVRHGRTALLDRAAADPAADLALTAVKETYAALGGALASRTTEERDTPGSLWRPDWTGSIIAKSRVNMLRNLDKLTARPFAANVDEVFFAVDDPDPARLGLRLGNGFGQYDLKHSAVPLGQVRDGIEQAARRARPAPLLTALDAVEVHQ